MQSFRKLLRVPDAMLRNWGQTVDRQKGTWRDVPLRLFDCSAVTVDSSKQVVRCCDSMLHLQLHRPWLESRAICPAFTVWCHEIDVMISSVRLRLHLHPHVCDVFWQSSQDLFSFKTSETDTFLPFLLAYFSWTFCHVREEEYQQASPWLFKVHGHLVAVSSGLLGWFALLGSRAL